MTFRYAIASFTTGSVGSSVGFHAPEGFETATTDNKRIIFMHFKR